MGVEKLSVVVDGTRGGWLGHEAGRMPRPPTRPFRAIRTVHGVSTSASPAINAKVDTYLPIAAMEASEHVVRIRRIDSKKEDDFVLLHVSCTTRNPINFRLLATEGEQAYVTTSMSTRYFTEHIKLPD